MKNKNLTIVVLTVFLPLFIRLFFLKYISNELDPSVYGKIVLIEIYIYGVTSILNSVLYQAYNRFYNSSIKDKFINEFRSYVLIINLLSCIFLTSVGVVYNYNLFLIFLICVYACSMNNYLFFQNIYFINLQRKKFLFIKLIEASIKFLLPIISIYLFKTVESFLAGIVLGFVLANIIFKLFLKLESFKFKVERNNLLKYLTFGFPIIFTSMFSWSISFIDRIFLEAMISISIVGTYSILSQLSGFAQVIGSIYSTYINPVIFKNYSINKKKTFINLNNYLKKLSIICLLCFALIISDKIIQNSSYYYSFLVLVFGIFLSIFQTALSMYFILIERLDIYSKIFGLAAVINFILNFFIYKYGVIAAAISTASAYLVINLLILFWLRANLKRYEEI